MKPLRPSGDGANQAICIPAGLVNRIDVRAVCDGMPWPAVGIPGRAPTAATAPGGGLTSPSAVPFLVW